MELAHFTCSHRLPLILKSGLLLPNNVVGTHIPLLWMTDLDAANAKALGLTSNTLECDRTEHKLRIVDPTDILDYRGIKKLLPRHISRMLTEHAEGVMPMHWYASPKPQKFEVVR